MKVYFIHRRLLLGLLSGVLPNMLKSSNVSILFFVYCPLVDIRVKS